MANKRAEARAISTHHNAINVLHLTDPHLFADDQRELRGTNTAQSLDAVLRAYSEDRWQAHVAIVSGDFVQDDSAGAYRLLRDKLETLGLPILLCPGNHDVPHLMAEQLSGPPFEICTSRRIGAWHLIGLSTYMAGSAGGNLSADELERLRDALSQNQSTPTLIYLHHPPLDLQSAWLDSVGLANKQQFLDVLAEFGGVRCILFGHAHQEAETKIGNILALGTPSTCRQFMPGSDKFALDDRPPAYRRLTLSPDGTVSTSVEWIRYD